MLKKLLSPVLITALIIQLLVPVGMIVFSSVKKNSMVKNGLELQFYADIENIDKNTMKLRIPTILNFSYSDDYSEYSDVDTSKTRYAVLSANENGFASIVTIQNEVPESPYYVDYDEFLYYNRIEYKSRESIAFRGYYPFSKNYSNACVTITAAVYKGELTVTGVFIDNVPIEDVSADTFSTEPFTDAKAS